MFIRSQSARVLLDCLRMFWGYNHCPVSSVCPERSSLQSQLSFQRSRSEMVGCRPWLCPRPRSLVAMTSLCLSAPCLMPRPSTSPPPPPDTPNLHSSLCPRATAQLTSPPTEQTTQKNRESSSRLSEHHLLKLGGKCIMFPCCFLRKYA